ncbi:MAG: TatD family hydrolase [Pararobbsia sp.]
MWIDSHCHLDRIGIRRRSRDGRGPTRGPRRSRASSIPSIGRVNFDGVRELAHRVPGGAYALGIHPLFTPHAHEADLDVLRQCIEASLGDPLFVGIGEIGLDYFVPGRDEARQQHFYDAQLKLARTFDLPVICHVRKSQDKVLKGLAPLRHL